MKFMLHDDKVVPSPWRRGSRRWDGRGQAAAPTALRVPTRTQRAKASTPPAAPPPAGLCRGSGAPAARVSAPLPQSSGTEEEGKSWVKFYETAAVHHPKEGIQQAPSLRAGFRV